jgi:NAD(P)-dependent dehydrogenase (short-subunit alcohol dehydrogenase family)
MDVVVFGAGGEALDEAACRRAAAEGHSLVLVLDLPRDAAFATLTRELAIEHGAAGVRVNAVWAPGAPAGEVEDAIAYLAGAGFVTGTILTLDGGRTVTAFGAL